MKKVYYLINEVSEIIGVKDHTIRYWEKHIPQLKPKKILNDIRHYRQAEIELLLYVKDLIKNKGFAVESVNTFLELKKKNEKKIILIRKELNNLLKYIQE